MRRFLESLDSEHASSATSVKVKVPVVLIDAISRSRSRGAGALAMLDRAKEQLVKTPPSQPYCESRKVLPPPKGGERAASMLRCPARSDYSVSLEGTESNRKRATFVLQEPCIRSTR